MKINTLLSALSLSFAVGALAAPETLTLDPGHTKPEFSVSHLGFSTTRGFFKETEGTLILDQAAKTGKLEATIKTGSVETGVDALNAHLRKPDFFNVEKFPVATVKADEFTFDGDKPVKATGTLTLLGQTKPITLNIAFNKCGTRFDGKYDCGAEVTTALKRSDWGMNFGIPFGISDDVQLAIQVEAIRAK